MAGTSGLISVNMSCVFSAQVPPISTTPVNNAISIILGAQAVTDSADIAPAIGSAAGDCDIVIVKQYAVVNSGTPLQILLSALTDPAGNACVPLHVVGYKFTNLDTGNTLTVRAGATHPVSWLPSHSASQGIPLPPAASGPPVLGSDITFRDPQGSFPISAGSADQMEVSSSGGSNSPFVLTLFARSA